jgi:hypothetical protein
VFASASLGSAATVYKVGGTKKVEGCTHHTTEKVSIGGWSAGGVNVDIRG